MIQIFKRENYKIAQVLFLKQYIIVTSTFSSRNQKIEDKKVGTYIMCTYNNF